MFLKRSSVALALMVTVTVGAAGADVIEVEIRDYAFAPAAVVIQPGDLVRWTWVGSFPHSSTAAVGFTEFWDSSLLGYGATFEHTFATAGTFPYHCELHGYDNGNGTVSGMSALIIVQGDGLTNNGLAPAIAGQSSTLWANGATPKNKVYFVYGLKPGTKSVPGCGGLQVDIARPKIIGSAPANAKGVAHLTVLIPASAANLTILTQAVDLKGCLVSNVVKQTLQ